ncbi:hypothetical protein [Samba virus]|nr:hypothetical protein [Samba virus]
MFTIRFNTIKMSGSVNQNTDQHSQDSSSTPNNKLTKTLASLDDSTLEFAVDVLSHLPLIRRSLNYAKNLLVRLFVMYMIVQVSYYIVPFVLLVLFGYNQSTPDMKFAIQLQVLVVSRGIIDGIIGVLQFIFWFWIFVDLIRFLFGYAKNKVN